MPLQVVELHQQWLPAPFEQLSALWRVSNGSRQPRGSQASNNSIKAIPLCVRLVLPPLPLMAGWLGGLVSRARPQTAPIRLNKRKPSWGFSLVDLSSLLGSENPV